MATRRLEVEFVGDTKSLNKALSKTRKETDKTAGAFKKVGSVVGGIVAFETLKNGVGLAIGEFQEARKVGAQTSAVLKSTGGAAHVTSKDVNNLAAALSKKAGIDDEVIQSGENMLLTFRGIRNETGKGNDIFNQATKAALDMSVAMGTDMKSSALQLGKALNDPTKGMTRLQRSGVTFTDQQKKQIETLQKSGDTLGAQKIILKELSKEFGGSAAAAATPLDKMKVAGLNLAEAAGSVLVPAIDKVAGFMTTLINQMIEGKGTGGALISVFRTTGTVIGTVIKAISGLVGWFKQHETTTLALGAAVGVLLTAFAGFKIFAAVQAAIVGVRAAMLGLNAAFLANPAVLIVVGLALLAAAFVVAWKKSETFRTIVIGTWNAIKAATVAVWGAVKSFLVGLWSALKTLVTGYFNAYRTVIVTAWNTVRSVTTAVWGTIKSVTTGVWGALRDAAGATWGAIKTAILTPIRVARDVLGDIWKAIRSTASGAWDKLKDGAGTFATNLKDAIVGAFKGAANAVIGFVNKIIDVINVIPGVPNMKHIKGLAEGGIHAQGFARGGAFARTGGIVDRPMTFMGEEAPRHPEFVIPTNPAYRGRAQGLLAAAAAVIGGGQGTIGSQGARSQGFKKGGVFGIADSVIDLIADGGKSLIGKLPNPGEMLPGWLKGLGTWTVEHVKKWITGKIGGLLGGPGGDWANVPADGRIAAMVAMANRMQMMRIPYGPQGHAGWPLNPYGEDCSSTVSKVLHAAGYLSNVLTTVGLPGALPHGPGKFVTVHDRALAGAAGHTIVQIGSKFFGTSNSNPGGGPGWINPGAGYLGTLPTKLHPAGLARGGLFGGLPFLGTYHSGGVAPREGLAHVARGETMTPAGMAPEIHVYIGDRELTDLVDVRIVERDRASSRTYRAGVAT